MPFKTTSSRLAAAWRWLWSQAWLVLGLMAFLSGANGVAARLAAGEMPPLMLVFARWAIVCATLAALLSADQRAELRGLVRDHWLRLAWMGLLGYAGFNALFYVAAYHTSAVNLTLLQSATPALVLVGAIVLLRAKVRLVQIAGLVLTAFGVALVATNGDVAHLLAIRLGIGDVLVLVACCFYAAYTLGLRVRPAGTPLVFFAGVALAALVWSIPMAVGEILSGRAYLPSPRGLAVTLFIAYGPSFVGQLCWMRGVDLIGPARTGLFANLIPVSGALCAVAILGEAFTATHALALACGVAGITLAELPALGRQRPSQRATPGSLGAASRFPSGGNGRPARGRSR